MIEETARLRRVVDMMLTMHSVLRDRYERRARLLDVSMLSVSVILCALAFADERLARYLALPAGVARDVVPAAVVLVFAFSVVSLRVDWKQLGSVHARACEVLARLKAELRSEPADLDTLRRNVSAALVEVPPIPESAFVALKAVHFRKLEVSKALSVSPGCPLFFVRILVIWRAARGAWNADRQNDVDSSKDS
jgi:hypothetical protein